MDIQRYTAKIVSYDIEKEKVVYHLLVSDSVRYNT